MADKDRPQWMSRRIVLRAGLGALIGGGIGVFAAPLIAVNEPLKDGVTPRSSAFPPSGSAPAQPGAFDYHVENLKPGIPWSQVPSNWDSSPVLSGFIGEHASTSEQRTISLYISSTLSTIHIYAYRLGHYAGLGQRLVWKSPPVAVTSQAGPAIAKDTKLVTTPWSATTTVDTTDWPEGFYYLVLSGGAGRDHLLPLVVESESLVGKAVLVMNDCTMQAYNRWGGYSLYRGPNADYKERAYKVSFDRPYENHQEFERRNAPMIRAAEAIQGHQLQLAYTTESRIGTSSTLVPGPASIVFSGHSEYWSPSMRHNVEFARDAGSNVIFLGANNVYWRTRMEPSSLGADRIMVCYREADLDPVTANHPELSTTMWRSKPHPEPESALTGSMYGDLRVTGAFTVSDPGFFAFAGTGAKMGGTYPGLIGGETDFVHEVLDQVPVQNPKGLHIFAHSPAAGTHNPHGWADATFYAAASGAGVINMGSLDWLQATSDLAVPAGSRSFAIKVTQNIIRESGRGQMGALGIRKPPR